MGSSHSPGTAVFAPDQVPSRTHTLGHTAMRAKGLGGATAARAPHAATPQINGLGVVAACPLGTSSLRSPPPAIRTEPGNLT